MEHQKPIAEIEYKPQATVLTILSDYIMDEEEVSRLRDTVEPLVMEPKPLRLIMDFGNVRSICSSAIGYLVALKQRIDQRQGRLIICCVEHKVRGTSKDKFIYEIFKVVNLDRYFELRPNVSEALELLDSGSAV